MTRNYCPEYFVFQMFLVRPKSYMTFLRIIIVQQVSQQKFYTTVKPQFCPFQAQNKKLASLLLETKKLLVRKLFLKLWLQSTYSMGLLVAKVRRSKDI